MSQRPRWAFIHPFQLRLRRGIEAYLWNLASALVQDGVDIDILTWQGPLAAPAYAYDDRVRLRVFPSVRYYQHLFAIPFYLQALLRTPYDHLFVHFAGYGEGQTLNLLRLFRTAPFSVVFHFPRSLVPHRYQEFEHWRYPSQAQHLVAVSQFVANQVEAWSGQPCPVITYGVDTRHFRPDPPRRQYIRASLGFQNDDHVLITVAALEARKGIQWVIKALPLVLETYPHTHYLILGEGEYRQPLESLIQGLHLQDHVHLLGAVSDVAPYLSAADIALLLSYGEAMPVALFEFAASALPIVTAQQPPFNEWIKTAWGQLVNEEDTAGVASSIISLLADPGRRAQMGLAGRAWMEKNHSWPQVAQQYRALVGS